MRSTTIFFIVLSAFLIVSFFISLRTVKKTVEPHYMRNFFVYNIFLLLVLVFLWIQQLHLYRNVFFTAVKISYIPHFYFFYLILQGKNFPSKINNIGAFCLAVIM